MIRSGEAPAIGWSRNMLYLGFSILPRSVVWSANPVSRSDISDVITLNMNKYKKQSEEKLNAAIVAGASFATPGSEISGDTRPGAVIARLFHLIFDDSSVPLVRDEDTLNGYVGSVYIAATKSEIVVFSIEITLWGSSLGDYLIRCDRDGRTSMRYSQNTKREVEFVTTNDQCFTLTTQDAAANVAALIDALTELDHTA